ncbi:MAG: hypothetical protein RL514_2590 [Verrucomicrobiota bacterium]|jgi:hypothetical protein
MKTPKASSSSPKATQAPAKSAATALGQVVRGVKSPTAAMQTAAPAPAPVAPKPRAPAAKAAVSKPPEAMKPPKAATSSPKATRSPAKQSATALGQVVRLLKNPTAAMQTATATPAPVALKLRAPAAKAVCVAGSFNGWQVGATPLHPAKGGEWQGELKLSPGRYEYLFVVDGTWLPDPAAHEAAPNPFGGWNSVLSVK